MFDQATIDAMFGPQPLAALQQADAQLTSAGYRVIGYHGTSVKNARNMVPDKLDPRFLGSGAGLARGPGFYVARSYNMAADYADESTQDPDYEPDPYARDPVTVRKDGEAGQLMILRVYALAPPSTPQNPTPRPLNTPSAWGVQTGAGDPNDDKKLPLELWPPSGEFIGTQGYRSRPIQGVAQQSNTELDIQRRELEIAISPNAYDQIIVIPSIAGDADYNFFAGWRPHDDIVDHLTRPSPGDQRRATPIH